MVAAQRARNQRDKVFRVNVISGGDPLEIYTDREGEVIFKKYSPIGELSSFAAQYADTLHRVCSLAVVICDRDAVIACSGVPKKDYADKALSPEMERLMESRNLFFHKDGEAPIHVLADGGAYCVSCAMPILSEGDIVGCVASVTDHPDEPHKELPGGEVETKLILTAAGFLGRQIEG
ncbi:MAG: stage V sporulation protein T [Ruminococcaceae bacterium]|nr:stage V sporulation protein T [Oscillospiraceae bacterium]